MQGYNCVVIYNSARDHILMCQRTADPYKGKLNVVGGKIDLDEHGNREDGFAAAYRELQEETGITPEQIELKHMMDFTYYNQGCYVEIYVGALAKATESVPLQSEKHPLCWVPLTENFFDLDKFAGEGNIGHMLEQVEDFGCGIGEKAGVNTDLNGNTATDNTSQRTGSAQVDNEPYTILCFGDSNTFGYNPMTGLRYPESIRWPKLLQAKLDAAASEQVAAEKNAFTRKPERTFRVIEEGCNGRTAAYVKEEEPWKYALPYLKPCLNTHKPLDLFILMLGSNDLKKMFPARPEEIAASIKSIIETTREFTKEKQGFAPQILLIAPPEIGSGIEHSPFSESFDVDAVAQSKAFAPLYKKVAEETGCDFLDAAVLTGSLPEDSLHLMPSDHAAFADAVYSMVCKIYTRTQNR